MVGLPAGFCYQRARRLPSPWPHHHRRAAQNKGRPPETSGPSAAMLRPVSMTSVRAAEGESNSACENTNSVRTRHTRNAPAAVPDAVEHSGLGRALTRAEGLRLRPVVSLSPRDNVRGPLAPPPRTRHDASGQVRAGPGTPGASRKSRTYQLQLLHARGLRTLQVAKFKKIRGARPSRGDFEK